MLTGYHEFKTSFYCNLNILSSFIYLKVRNEPHLSCLTLHLMVMGRIMRMCVKYDINIKFKSYKIGLLKKLIV